MIKRILSIVLFALLLCSCSPAQSTPDGGSSAPESVAASDGETPKPGEAPDLTAQFPDKPLPASCTAGMLADMTDEEKVGQLFLFSLPGAAIDDNSRSFLKETHAGNVILYADNLSDAAQTAAYCKAIQDAVIEINGVPAIIAVDQEGGEIARVRAGATRFPGAMASAAAAPALSSPADELVRAEGLYTGVELRALGFNCNLAPVADVLSNPQNPVIGARSYGDDPQKVASLSAAFALGLQDGGVMAVAKHYPGHGDAAVDSHYQLPVVDKSLDALRQTELVPFTRLAEQGVGGVMTAHIRFPQLDSSGLPATLSQPILSGMLRNGENGGIPFDGLIFTDSMQMKAITSQYGMGEACVLALNAGADVLVTGAGNTSPDDLSLQKQAYDAVLAAVRDGRVSRETLDDRVLRILNAKQRFGILQNPYAPEAETGHSWPEHEALAEQISRGSVTLLRDRDSLLPLSTGVSGSALVIAPDANGFAEQAAQRLGGSTQAVSASPTDAEIEACIARAIQYPAVVIACDGAQFDFQQQKLINSVFAVNANTVTVLFGTPYDSAYLDAGTVLCVYENTPRAAAAAVGALVGDAPAAGTLPVRIPG